MVIYIYIQGGNGITAAITAAISLLNAMQQRLTCV
jgi:hypothetical protein